MPPVDLKARLAELEKQWRGEAHLGSRLERGKGRDEAMLHCADQLAALLVGEEPPADKEPQGLFDTPAGSKRLTAYLDECAASRRVGAEPSPEKAKG